MLTSPYIFSRYIVPSTASRVHNTHYEFLDHAVDVTLHTYHMDKCIYTSCPLSSLALMITDYCSCDLCVLVYL